MINRSLIKAIITFFIIAMSQITHAGNCETIKDSKKRLQCFDLIAKQNSKNGIASSEDRIKREQKEAEVRKLETYIAEARKVLQALHRMESRVASGISYREYYQPLSDIRYEVNQFSNSDAGNALPHVKRNFEDAHAHYAFAGEVWRLKFSGGRVSDSLRRFEAPDVFDELENKYKITDMIVTGLFGGNNIGKLYASALQVIWINAEESRAKAERVIKAGGALIVESETNTTTTAHNIKDADTSNGSSQQNSVTPDSDQVTRVNFDSEIGKKHPDWQHTISSQKFKDWLSNQSDAKKRAIENRNPKGIVIVLDSYKASQL